MNLHRPGNVSLLGKENFYTNKPESYFMKHLNIKKKSVFAVSFFLFFLKSAIYFNLLSPYSPNKIKKSSQNATVPDLLVS